MLGLWYNSLMNKKCTKCKKTLLITDFYRDKCKKDGLKSYCKKCDALIAYRYGNQIYNKRKAKRRSINRTEMNDSYWKQLAARHQEKSESLKRLYESQFKLCYYCKIHIDGNNLQLDHYNPGSNEKLVLACSDCNRLKWHRQCDEFINFISSYIKRFS